MARTTVGAENDREKALQSVNALLNSELTNQAAYGNLAAAARLELIRRSLVLLLRIARRVLK
jgi:hypothetical protein